MIKSTVIRVIKFCPGFLIALILAAVPFSAKSADDEADDLTQGQINIVLRARQVMEIEWTPLKEIISWEGYEDFKAGEVYQGIPYGRPSDPENYVPFGTSFEVFLSALADTDSLMYTSNSTNASLAPYYSSDCSAFLSWAWELDDIHKTTDVHLVADYISGDLNDIEVGDALNKDTEHVALVSHVERGGDGSVIRVGIMELLQPIAQFTMYGSGERLSLSVLRSIYLDDGYEIYRYRDRDDVQYVHDCIIPIDDDFCYHCIDLEQMWFPKLLEALRNTEARMRCGAMTAFR